jgi:glycosyltransferase involved in cell wall biosynthesis
MKVLHLTTWQQRCGIADFAESIVTHLARQGVENEVFPLNTAALRYATAAELRSDYDRALRMAGDFDLVHIQHEFGFFAGSGGLFESIANFGYLLSGLKAANRPTVVTFHGEPAFTSLVPSAPAGQPGAAATLQSLIGKLRTRRIIHKLERLWQRQVASHFDGQPGSFRGLVHTPRTRLGVIRSGLAPQCVSVMPMGHSLRDPAFLTANRATAKAQLGLPPESILLTIFGFVTAYKGHLLAVQALKKLPPQYHLAIVGGPNLANSSDTTLNSILETWDGEDPQRLMITGFVARETIDLYHAATDICLAPFLPGNIAGSASATWAFTSGKPTIASNIPAFAEIQQAVDCLLLCTPNAVHELAWHIRQLASNPALQTKLAHNALQFAALHSWERVIEGLIGTYREMASWTGSTSRTPKSGGSMSTELSLIQSQLQPAA